jgi:hypothetical protein
MQEAVEDDDFASRLVFSDEATFHLSGKVNRHNLRIWGMENPHPTIEHKRDTPKLTSSEPVPGQSFMALSFSWKNQ